MVCRYGRHVPGNAGDLARERLSAMLERPVATTDQAGEGRGVARRLDSFQRPLPRCLASSPCNGA